MLSPGTAQIPRRRRLLRLAGRLLAVAALLLAAAATGLFVFLDANRFKPWLERQLSTELALPFSVQSLDLQLFPSPRLVGYGVQLGDGDFAVHASEVTVRARLLPLLQKQLPLSHILVRGATLRLPGSLPALEARWNAYLEDFEAIPGGKPLISLAIDTIESRDVSVFGADREVLHADIQVFDVLNSAIPFQVAATALNWTNTPRIEGSFTLDVAQPNGVGISGALRLNGVQLHDLADHSVIPDAVLNLNASLSGMAPGDLRIVLEGDSTRSEDAAGPVSGVLWITESGVHLNDIEWDDEDLALRADLSLPNAGGWAMNIASLSARADVLDPLLELVGADALRLHGGAQRQLTANGVLLGARPGAGFRMEQGAGAFSDLELRLKDQADAIAGVHGAIAVTANQFAVQLRQEAGLDLALGLHADFEATRMALQATGTLPVYPAMVGMLTGNGKIESAGGRIAINALACTLPLEDDFLDTMQADFLIQEGHASFVMAGRSEPMRLASLQGGIQLAAGRFTISAFKADDFSVDGSIAHTAGEGYLGNFRLEGPLTSPVLTWALAGTPIEPSAGKIALDRCTFAVTESFELGDGISLAGNIQDGAFKISGDRYQDAISACHATFASADQSVIVTLNARSEKLGGLGFDGALDTAQSRLEGKFAFDAAAAGHHFLTPESAAALWVQPALNTIGAAEAQIALDLPRADRPSLHAAFELRNGPAISGTATWGMGEGATAMKELAIDAQIDLAPYAGRFLPSFQPTGPAAVAVRMAEKQPGSVRLELTPTTLKIGDFLTKPAGTPASVAVTLPETGPAGVRIECLGESVELQAGEPGVRIESFDVALAPLNPLLSQGGALGGRLSGNFDSAQNSGAVQFTDARLMLSESLGLDAVNGLVTCTGGFWVTGELQVNGAESDFTVRASKSGAEWEAAVDGRMLNLNAVEALWKTAQSLRPAKDPEAAQSSAGSARGVIRLNMETVRYKRAELQQASTSIYVGPTELRFEDATIQAGGGTVTGAAAYRFGGGGAHDEVRIDLKLDQADIRVVDELFLDPPRELRGATSGIIQLAYQVDPLRPWTSTTNGVISFDAAEGTFGRMGATTRLLSFLRTTDVFRLRLPALRDEGLRFKKTTGALTFVDGRASIDAFQLEDSAYAITASGWLDYANAQSDVRVQADLLESVTGIISAVPVLGQAVKKIGKAASMRLRGQGPPEEINFSINPLGSRGRSGREATAEEPQPAAEAAEPAP
ncbi:MAG: AsmA-like C-terminal region-containing protein [Candidatus Hydrogenedentes bacterium]|nr:AsmA-like C-terminal region-containing protein [Candidatus Hydrogenedentota bacterium]